MPSQNYKISSENHEFGGKVSGYIDEKFAICSRNFEILAGKQDLKPCLRLDFEQALRNAIIDAMVKKEIPKKKMTIDDLAVMVARGFDDVKKDLRGDMSKMESGIRGDMSKMESGIRGDMTKMENGIRGDMTKMENGIRGDMAKMEKGIRGDMAKMEKGIRGDMVKMETNIRNDFQTKLVDVEDRLTVRINGLEKLVEKKVVNLEPGKGELHSLNLRISKLEKKVGV
jgi:uncharacterized protein YajQ (UPF0234 family)